MITRQHRIINIPVCVHQSPSAGGGSRSESESDSAGSRKRARSSSTSEVRIPWTFAVVGPDVTDVNDHLHTRRT